MKKGEKYQNEHFLIFQLYFPLKYLSIDGNTGFVNCGLWKCALVKIRLGKQKKRPKTVKDLLGKKLAL